MITLNDIRTNFIEFFKNTHHTQVTSSSLIPHNDPTLMFTNAGMVQFKDIFTGKESKNCARAVSAQKCVRAGGKHNDLENVGFTSRHHTFFEMLGNFSFGDYFKEEAIYFAWQFINKELELPVSKLYVTVHANDDQSAKLWQKITPLAQDRIIKIDNSDNFWSMGDTGPCGPCTEIFYDHGPKVFGGLPGTKEEDGDRYVEIWNIVFMQYEQLLDGKLVDLEHKSVDTGLGIERLAAIMQNVTNNYEIDLFVNLITAISTITRQKPTNHNINSFRVIADHLRSVAFLIADGVTPSNEGRGYILRRIMRRSIRHIHQLGCNEPIMHMLLPTLINEMGGFYPELSRLKDTIADIMKQEEIRFRETLRRGIKLLDEEIDNMAGNNKFSGNTAFKLYDTYGFPFDLTESILKEKNITIDQNEFEQNMEQQRQRARASWAGSGDITIDSIWYDILSQYGVTSFTGYQQLSDTANILKITNFGNNKYAVITDRTPFYAESGGQVGDTGFIKTHNGKQIAIIDTLKFLNNIHAHIIANKDDLVVGNKINLIVDQERRRNIRSNHSATHLLHSVLRKILGNHVIQKGSLVTPTKLRFDFVHHQAMTQEQVEQVEQLVNKIIFTNIDTQVNSMQYQKAIDNGAIALFSEKYDDEVRVINIGDSIELCGGTHVKKSGDIGLFKIVSESSLAAGIRRIEAVTNMIALSYVNNIGQTINSLSIMLKAKPQDLQDKVVSLIKQQKILKKEIAELKQKALGSDDTADHEVIGDCLLISKILPNTISKDARIVAENLRSIRKNAIIVVIAENEGKTSIIIALGKDIKNLDATMLVKESIISAGGKGGGGRKDIAQAGGFDFSQTQNIIHEIKKIIFQNI